MRKICYLLASLTIAEAGPRLKAHDAKNQVHESLRLLARSEEHTSELQSPCNLACRLLLDTKRKVGLSVEAVVERKINNRINNLVRLSVLSSGRKIPCTTTLTSQHGTPKKRKPMNVLRLP